MMTAESIEEQRVYLARTYIHSQPTAEENAPLDSSENYETETSQPVANMVSTFAQLCSLQDIDIQNVKPIDREDIAREAHSFVSILHNLGHTAVAGPTPQRMQLRFGANQLKAKLRDHFNSPDLEARDAFRAKLQREKEERYIHLANSNEVYFPEVQLAHRLMRDLMTTSVSEVKDGVLITKTLEQASYSVRDLIITMGMAIEDIIQRQRQLAKDPVMANTKTQPDIAQDGV